MAEHPAAYHLVTPPSDGRQHQAQQQHHQIQHFHQHHPALEPGRNEIDSRMASFWDQELRSIDAMPAELSAFKNAELPLARIKKIMKIDDDVKGMMIAAEAPLLFSKAAEIFIRELTVRAWAHTERARRRTLQRNDIAMSVGDPDTDQFDFLIDIVPREMQQQQPPAPPPHAVHQPHLPQDLQHQHNNHHAGVTTKASADVSPTAAAVVATVPASTATAPVQYVIQLPVGTGASTILGGHGGGGGGGGGVNGQQPLQIFINSSPQPQPPLRAPQPQPPLAVGGAGDSGGGGIATLDVKPNIAAMNAAAAAGVPGLSGNAYTG